MSESADTIVALQTSFEANWNGNIVGLPNFSGLSESYIAFAALPSFFQSELHTSLSLPPSFFQSEIHTSLSLPPSFFGRIIITFFLIGSFFL